MARFGLFAAVCVTGTELIFNYHLLFSLSQQSSDLTGLFSLSQAK